jgi:hypothetical protein
MPNPVFYLFDYPTQGWGGGSIPYRRPLLKEQEWHPIRFIMANDDGRALPSLSWLERERDLTTMGVPKLLTTTLQKGQHAHRTFLTLPYLPILRAISHTGLRARDHYTSSTLIGGKQRSRSKFTFTLRLRGPMEWVCECTMDVVMSTWVPAWHRMIHVSWSRGIIFHKP